MPDRRAAGAVVLAERYALTDRLAQGGMSVVWRGLDLRLHREVAIKVLTPRDERDRDRVMREARLLAATPHPNVVQVLDVGLEDDRPFIVMELLEGTTLDRALAQSRVTPLDALDIAAATLAGLAGVHRRGIVHRDLKPANLFLAREPGVHEPAAHGALAERCLKILDFGVSRATDRDVAMRSALTTREGALVGTPEYMAPEQARGLPEIGPAADLYAVGVVLFECLTGKLPFASPNPGDLIIAIATAEPPSLTSLRPDLPTSLGTLVHKALAKKPEDRFDSASAMRQVVLALRAELASGDGTLAAAALAREERASAITLDPVDVAPAGASGRSKTLVRASIVAVVLATLALTAAVVALVTSEPSGRDVAGTATDRAGAAHPEPAPAPIDHIAHAAPSPVAPAPPAEAVHVTTHRETAPSEVVPPTAPAAPSVSPPAGAPARARPGPRVRASAASPGTMGEAPRFRELDY